MRREEREEPVLDSWIESEIDMLREVLAVEEEPPPEMIQRLIDAIDAEVDRDRDRLHWRHQVLLAAVAMSVVGVAYGGAMNGLLLTIFGTLLAVAYPIGLQKLSVGGA